jgi:hypothetical protein
MKATHTGKNPYTGPSLYKHTTVSQIDGTFSKPLKTLAHNSVRHEFCPVEVKM